MVGVISATSGDFGPFRSVEESTISHLTTPATRTDVLSWYVTTSTLGSALGNEAAGHIASFLKRLQGSKQDITDVYHALFWIYVAMGVLSMIFACLMSRKLWFKSKIAEISQESLSVVIKLWILLTIDSLADGMVSYALTNYYLVRKFGLAESYLGDIMSICFLLMAISTAFAGPLARRLGLINTMVFTHLPSSLAVLLLPVPQNVGLTIALLFIRTGLNSMDQGPRAAFIAAVVKPGERTAVMGITAMLRTLGSTIGPSLTGFLADTDKFWIAFVVAGALRVAYDLGLFYLFVDLKINAPEQAKDPATNDQI
ncbi:MFS transporter, putative [Trichophyton benhamiae CBS 112371]|uniref:MFS transporter, putative n=1 Tax=Arthroderma benhamiae (strain ATCC MYA-4681 / CBS 112371) TaxID=663331 RepID=D4ALU1_ARTBC|nr:MFS transporter, putative [Trichophyton benhamiae CBS 112371]EFE36350.1 MFS transporter, putative [Trichophyton benhamiae CBS 112371]